jgi:cytochrome c
MESERMPHNLKQTGNLWRLLSILFITGVMIPSGCERGVEFTAAELTGGDPQRGREMIRAYGCQSCHTIPGVRGANGLVGPPLNHIARRVYIAGILPNSPDNLMRWIQNPQAAIQQPTAMPNMGISEADARDIVAYLYKLR